MECSIPVAGNGLTLGFYNGSSYGGKVGNGYLCYTGLYGKAVGTNSSGGNTGSTSIGVTKDSSKSGLVGTLPSRNISSKELGRWFIRF